MKRFDIALIDAQNAIARDTSNPQPCLRAGKAYLGLEEADDASAMFHKAIELCDASHCHISANATTRRGAESGLRRAASMSKKLRDEHESAILASNAALRPRLAIAFQGSVEYDDAAAMLYAAEEVLKSKPHCENAKLSRAEGLILCGRYDDALCFATDELVDGIEKYYLKAEASFRSGNCKDSLEFLRVCNGFSKSALKITQMQVDIERYLNVREDADKALEEEKYACVIDLITDFFASEKRRISSMQQSYSERNEGVSVSCPPLCRAELLQRRAQAFVARSMIEEAEKDAEIGNVLHFLIMRQ